MDAAAADPPRRAATFAAGDFETFLGDVPEQGPESDGARAVREWCETALALAKLDMVARTEENDTQIIVRLYGSDARAADRSARRAARRHAGAGEQGAGRPQGREGRSSSIARSSRDSASEDLEQRAREVADRVRRGGREELLPAMTPIERRIVHIALRDDADVTTESRGDGFYKRVAIILRSEARTAATDEAGRAASRES